MICVHFSESSVTYCAAFKYISKTDKNVYEDPNHPDLKEAGSPKIKKNAQMPTGGSVKRTKVSKKQRHQQMKQNLPKLKG